MNFGLEEMAIDHTAGIDYILQSTGQESLSTIAYSMGGAVILAAESMNSEYYFQRVDVSVLIVPAISLQYNRSPLINYLMSFPGIFDILRLFNINEFGGYNPIQGGLTHFACPVFPLICRVFTLVLVPTDPNLDDQISVNIANSHGGQGTSTK